MNPGLISRKRLRRSGWVPDRGKAPAAMLGLILAVATAGTIQARVHDPEAQTPQLRIVASTTYIAGTTVPMPDASIGLAEIPARVEGRYLFQPEARRVSLAQASSLFDGYLSAMVATGWTLRGKSVPDHRGNWILRWDSGVNSTLITFYSNPSPRLIVDVCPPEPYC